MSADFVDVSGLPSPGMPHWAPIVIKRAQIEREIERLAEAPRPANGVRAARIVHPMSSSPGLGMSPGIDVTICVLRPGESTTPFRHNSSQISLCIRGSAVATIGSRRMTVEVRDVWNTPGMRPYAYKNNGDELFVRLSYSNAPLLEKLLVHYVEEMPSSGFRSEPPSLEKTAQIGRAKQLALPIKLTDDGAELLTYEHLISPEVVENHALLWPWKRIEVERDRVFPVGRSENLGRRGLFVLYNPATGRTVGTTHNFFATIGFMPAEVLDRPHRHSSNAINYALEGAFISDVDGEEYEWLEGDLAYTAPGWAAHANGSRNRSGGTALTVQDHPFQIATECLIWQEGEERPILLLGSQKGFESEEAVRVA